MIENLLTEDGAETDMVRFDRFRLACNGVSRDYGNDT